MEMCARQPPGLRGGMRMHTCRVRSIVEMHAAYLGAIPCYSLLFIGQDVNLFRKRLRIPVQRVEIFPHGVQLSTE